MYANNGSVAITLPEPVTIVADIVNKVYMQSLCRNQLHKCLFLDVFQASIGSAITFDQ